MLDETEVMEELEKKSSSIPLKKGDLGKKI
jgi:hypothetical protein